MLETLSNGFRSARNFLNGQALLTESNVKNALVEIRKSLLDADVHADVVEQFLQRVQDKALGLAVTVSFKNRKISPAEHFIRICQEELESLMDSGSEPIQLKKPIASLMMVGLQGSGKTTSTAKLARFYQKLGYKPLLVGADIYRPAAIQQLEILGKELGIPVFSAPDLQPPELCVRALEYAKAQNFNLVLFDTAGRLAIDDKLMSELESIKRLTNPDQVMLVIDAMMGQDAVNTASEFNRRLEVDGIILTKLDGDARGGAALSVRTCTGKPIRFLGVGEKNTQLEEFRAQGLASRILGMGDIVSLVKDFEEHIDQEKAEKDAQRMMKGRIGLQDFLDQIRMIRKIGPIAGLLEKLPGMGSLLPMLRSDGDAQIRKIESLILSMTPQERHQPDLIRLSKTRKRRIAQGSGRKEQDLEDLLKQFAWMKEKMQNIGKLGGLRGSIPPMPRSSAEFSAPKLDPNRKEKRKREKLARKKNKRK
ncbi:MAG: signal recognition particle protein [Myxococcaceae bacterium]|nr:signal recognition particle protein [Myxococcaceae bacterium]MBH2005976.1 signal recognition particle protein [Myxococcaceae bacterium]